MYYKEEKKAFKPGWQSMRHQQSIKQDQERVTAQAAKDERNAACHALRAQRVNEWGSYNKFNPITGQQMDPGSGTWKPATDPWQHQKAVIKPASTIQAAMSSSKPDPAARMEKAAEVAEMRKARLANDGLYHTKRTGGTVRDLMQWKS